MFAEERPPRRKLLSNNKTCQHCRPKPSPFSNAAPIHTNPVHSDVRHQELQGVQERTLVSVHVQGGGRVHVEEGKVPRLPPEPPDTQGLHQPALTGGGRVHAFIDTLETPVQGGAKNFLYIKVISNLIRLLRTPVQGGDRCTYFLLTKLSSRRNQLPVQGGGVKNIVKYFLFVPIYRFVHFR